VKDIEGMIGEVLEREGGYTDNPADGGGPTNRGITQARLSSHRGHPCSAADVQALTEAEAREIYRADYLMAPGLYQIHDPYVLALAFDIAVNHGPRRAVQWLQRICGVPEDGQFGTVTEIAVNSFEPVRLYQKLLARRIVFYGEILSHDHNQAVFALGWLRRAASFVEVA